MDPSPLVEHLRDLQLLRVLWCDNSSVIRTKCIFLPAILGKESDPVALVDRLNHAITFTATCQSLPAIRDEPIMEADLAPVQDVRLVPAWETFSVCPQTPRVGAVIGDMVLADKPWLHCPRSFLSRVQASTEKQGIHIELGSEIEFYLLKTDRDENGELVPVDHAVYAASAGAQKNQGVISDILDALWDQGIAVAQYNPEAGPGQHEISLEHSDPLTMADRIVKARESIRATAMEHGLIASFVPMLFADSTGSGMHTHFSLWSEDNNLLPDPQGKWEITDTAQSFVAGVLEHLPALMAATTPNVNSFHRTQPHEWSGAYQAWGIENKEAALRLIHNASDE